ncbi:MAG TPA: glycosyltransferase [Longimicrobiales bacterium]
MAARRIVHVPFCYFPEAVGGTEVYVRDLAREQQKRGHRVMILAPADKRAAYLHDFIPVVRYAVPNQITDVSDLYTARNTDVEHFISEISQFSADVVHVHGVGRALAPLALERLHELGMRAVLTYHTPTTTCVRGTLLHLGTHPCDGALDAHRCTACTLTSHGVPAGVATMLARAPAAAGTMLRAVGARGRVVTALRMRELVSTRHDQTRRILGLADHVVAPAEWVVRLLIILGVPEQKITLSRQGVRKTTTAHKRTTSEKLRLIYVGRLEPMKGIHLLMRALKMMPAAAIELHVYGVVQNDAHQAFRRELQRDFERDRRVVVHEPVGADDVVDAIAQYDVLVAPSQQLETGPLVVLEAFAAGIPVVGSKLGGIAELVEHNVNGLLVDDARAESWANALKALVADRALLMRLAANVRAPRSMATVAEEMDVVYTKALQA